MLKTGVRLSTNNDESWPVDNSQTPLSTAFIMTVSSVECSPKLKNKTKTLSLVRVDTVRRL